MFRYKLLRFRSKISFEAFRQKKTVQELMLTTIMQSYSDLLKSGELPQVEGDYQERFRHRNYVFMGLMKSSLKNIFKTIFQLNADQLRNDDPLAYKKLKFEEAISQLNDLREANVLQVTDSYGRKVNKVINHSENILKAAKFHGFFKQDRAYDMFADVQTGNKMDKAEKLNQNARFHYNKNRESLLHLYNKCKILINFKAIRHILYIKCCLMKI